MKRKQKARNIRYLLFVNLFSLAGFNIFAPLYSIYARGLAITPRHIGLIWSAYSLTMALSILLFGRIENSLRKGRLAVLGYFIYSLGSVAFLVVNNQTTLVAVMLFNALASGIVLPAYKTMFAHDEAKGRESEQWSWLDAGTQMAAALGAAVGGVIIGIWGFHGVFITMAVVQFVAALVAWQTLYRHA